MAPDKVEIKAPATPSASKSSGHGEMPTPGIGNAGGDYNSPANVAARIAKARSTATGGAHMLDEHDSF